MQLVTYGDVIKNLRLSLRLSQQRLSDHCGVCRSFISELECNRKPLSLTVIRSIAEGIRVCPVALLFFIESKVSGNESDFLDHHVKSLDILNQFYTTEKERHFETNI